MDSNGPENRREDDDLVHICPRGPEEGVPGYQKCLVRVRVVQPTEMGIILHYLFSSKFASEGQP